MTRILDPTERKGCKSLTHVIMCKSLKIKIIPYVTMV